MPLLPTNGATATTQAEAALRPRQGHHGGRGRVGQWRGGENKASGWNNEVIPTLSSKRIFHERLCLLPTGSGGANSLSATGTGTLRYPLRGLEL